METSHKESPGTSDIESKIIVSNGTEPHPLITNGGLSTPPETGKTILRFINDIALQHL